MGDKSILLAASSMLTEISVTSQLIVCSNLLVYHFTVFSLNFSSVGKEPFMASTAKNAPETTLSCGGREGHGPELAWKFRS